ncbi:MAG: Bax inhibitor-1/YccA family protein [Actinomycetota bacterium]|nr:Bax inhibitor-1/YccA family protein [Actinomycetota bacterium]
MTATMVPSGGGNPAFDKPEIQRALASPDSAAAPMTVAGVFVKTVLFLVALVIAGAYGWNATVDPGTATDAVGGYGNTTVTIPGGFWLASFVAFGVGIYTSVNPRHAMVTGFVYALLQGYILGSVSAMFDTQTEGIVSAAVLGTVCVLAVSLFLYASRVIRPTAKMAFGVSAGIGGLCLLYFLVWMLSIFDVDFLYSDQFRSIGIVVTIAAIVLAALSLTLNFAAIEAGVASGAPAWLEWYSAYGLMLTLIWLYLTILRLLALLGSRR